MNVDALLSAGDPGDLCDAMMDLLDTLEGTIESVGLDGLPAAVRSAYWVLVTDSAMNNEGVGELPEGSSAQVSAALREVGLASLLPIFEGALAAPNDTVAGLVECPGIADRDGDRRLGEDPRVGVSRGLRRSTEHSRVHPIGPNRVVRTVAVIRRRPSGTVHGQDEQRPEAG